MPDFQVKLAIGEFLLPYFNLGLIVIAVALYMYMYFRTKDKLYLAALVSGIAGLIFTFCEAIIALFGAYYHDVSVVRQFHRIEQVYVTGMLVFFPYLLKYLLVLNKKWHKINNAVIKIGFVLWILTIGAAFLFPELFISMTKMAPKGLIIEYSYGRGLTGILYSVRDLFLGLLVIYALFMFIKELILHKNFNYILLPFFGLIVLIYSSVVDITSVYRNTYIDFFPDKYFSRFSIGILVFIMCIMAAGFRKFIDVYFNSKRNEEKLTSLNIYNKKVLNDISANSSKLSSESQELLDIFSMLENNAAQMNEKSGNLSDSIEKINNNIRLLSSSTGNSTENINMVSTSTEEMATSVSNISQNAEKTKTVVSDAARNIGSATEKVNILSDSAKEIEKIITIISEIADQTKLLALNATIEAARAGEAGKGFAVVASEVKGLAKKVNNAASDIKQKIEQIQNSISAAINEISNISNIINNATDSVNTIASSVEEQSITTKGIAENISKTVEETNEINRNIDRISDSTQSIVNDSMSTNRISSEVNTLSVKIKESANKIAEMSENLKNLAYKD